MFCTSIKSIVLPHLWTLYQAQDVGLFLTHMLYIVPPPSPSSLVNTPLCAHALTLSVTQPDTCALPPLVPDFSLPGAHPIGPEEGRGICIWKRSCCCCCCCCCKGSPFFVKREEKEGGGRGRGWIWHCYCAVPLWREGERERGVGSRGGVTCLTDRRRGEGGGRGGGGGGGCCSNKWKEIRWYQRGGSMMPIFIFLSASKVPGIRRKMPWRQMSRNLATIFCGISWMTWETFFLPLPPAPSLFRLF